MAGRMVRRNVNRPRWRAWFAWGLAVGAALITWPLTPAPARAQVPTDEIVRLTPTRPGVSLTGNLSPEQAQWVREHAIVNVGLVPNDLVPFDLVGFDREYEGISADYLDIIARTLGVELRFHTFANKAAALAALERDEVDLVPTVSRLDAKGTYQLSAPYFSTQFVEVVAGDRPLASGTPLRVASVTDRITVAALHAAYPDAVLTAYPNALEGLHAVASHEADVLVGNSASVNFLIDQYHMSTLRVYGFGEEGVLAQHMAVRRDDPELLQLINNTLAAIPARIVRATRLRWSGPPQATAVAQRVNLTAQERQWIADNPTVRYSVADNEVPFMFRDSAGRLNGLTIEILHRIGVETGISFEPGGKYDGKLNKDDIVPLLLRGRGSSEGMLLSSTYFRGFWVFVSRTGQTRVTGLSDLEGKRLAFNPPNSIVQRLKARVPGLVLVPVDSVVAAYEAVRTGQADLTLGSTKSANFMVEHIYPGVLQVGGSLGNAPIGLMMGVRADAPELLSIIDKALLTLPLDSTREMRANDIYFAPHDVDWRRYARWLYALAILLSVCAVLVLLWTRSLKNEVRRRVQAEAEVRAQLQFQRAMLEGIPHAICMRDVEGRLIGCNSAFERLFQVPRKTLMGTTLIEMASPNYLPSARAVHQEYLRLLEEGGGLSEEIDLEIGGELRRVWYWAATIATETGGPNKAIVAGALDMTERHQLVQLIEAARAKAEAANRAKSNFLATMSHEIRTPMNAVLGMLELVVREGRLAGGDRESIELARNSAKGLLGLIDDILDISKIEAGGLEVTPVPSQLRPIVRDVAQVFAELARRRGLTIAIEVDPAVAKWHEVDPVRFRQIVNNLVSNAIKYTDSGGVTIRLQHESLLDGVETVNLEVRDTGIGIANNEIKNLFQPFFQAESAGPRAIGGTGLGLPIVQRLCRSMGSEISVQSEPARGTVVTIDFRLPVAQPPVNEVTARLEGAEEPQLARDRYNVLVVDDHPANRMLLQRQLAHLGVSSVAAENGRLALELWRNGKFDLVVTDLSMPVMDGYAFTAALRAQERTLGWNHCPVLGCTAHVQEQERRRALDIGMDECLMKPISVDTLTDALRRHLGSTSVAPQEEAAPVVEPAAAPAFDVATLHGFSGGDGKIESSFLDALLRTNLSDFDELSVLVHAGDSHAIASGAHKIKGAARIVKARRVVHDCEMLEQAAHGGVAAEIQAAFGNLTRSLGEFNGALQAQLRVYDPQPTSP